MFNAFEILLEDIGDNPVPKNETGDKEYPIPHDRVIDEGEIERFERGVPIKGCEHNQFLSKKNGAPGKELRFVYRSRGIRTPDLLLPKQPR